MLGRVRRLGKWLKWAGALLALGASALFMFPGQQLGIAVTLGTGLGRGALQERVDGLEAKAIGREKLSADDEQFLRDLYGSLATGGKLSIVVRQTGKMMDHYLARSGADYRLEPGIFTGNRKVQAQAQLLRDRVAASGCRAARISSPTFYMPDSSNVDSVFGLYHGTLHVSPSVGGDGGCHLHWRAEVPWVWPSYPSLAEKYGDPQAESFPLPNLRSLIFGQEHALFVDNGLGGYLADIGLAKSFLAFAEWTED